MRVTIEHREEAGGVAGQRRTYFVDCTIAFSEEERAIIKARDLYGEGVTVTASTPLPSRTAILGSGAIRPLGALAAVAGAYIGLASLFTQWGGDLAGFLFFGGIALATYGWLKGRRIEKRLDTTEQTITIRQLIATPTFTVHASNAGFAKVLEEDIRQHLASLKALIQESAQLPARQTFEL